VIWLTIPTGGSETDREPQRLAPGVFWASYGTKEGIRALKAHSKSRAPTEAELAHATAVEALGVAMAPQDDGATASRRRAVCFDHSTSIPAGRNAQSPDVRRRLGERAS
jgi:hypothetical protein